MSKQLIEITGFAELQAKLTLIGNDRQKVTEIKKVLRKVAMGTVKVARRKAPVSKRPHTVSGQRTKKVIQPQALSKSIGVINGRDRVNPTVFAGPRAKGTFDGWYGHFVHDGHNVYAGAFKRKRSTSGKAKAFNALGAKKRTKANPFMDEAYNETKGQVTQEMESQVTKVIQRTIDRYSI